MARQLSIVWLAPVVAAGLVTQVLMSQVLVTQANAAALAPSTIRMSTVRIEPTRPGGLPGAPRESSPSCQFETDQAQPEKCIVKPKRRRH